MIQLPALLISLEGFPDYVMILEQYMNVCEIAGKCKPITN